MELMVPFTHRSPDGTPLSENQKKKRIAKWEKDRKKAETAARVAAEKEKKEASEVVSEDCAGCLLAALGHVHGQ